MAATGQMAAIGSMRQRRVGLRRQPLGVHYPIRARRVLVEKNPRHTLRIPFLKAIFPDAKIIHIVRDGRDVTCSLVPGCGGLRGDT